MILELRLPESLFIRARARHIKDCEAVWVNEPALTIRCGLHSVDVMRDFVTRNYAYELAQNAGLGDPSAEFLVDRYGTTGVKRYGGSGRAGLINGVQLKGIGPTPLVDPLADASHSHGMLSLREAIKECLFSGLASQMFPVGSVETLAVIRLGRCIEYPGCKSEEAALLVRPFVLRPSHLQRAVGFSDCLPGLGGHKHDVLRVKHAVAFVERAMGCDTLNVLVRTIAQQIAHCHLYRWFGGGVLSSNYSLDGRMLDFGAADLVPSWRRNEFNSFGPAFGDEERFCGVMIESLSFYFSKFGAAKHPTVGALVDVYREAYDRTLVSAIATWLGVRLTDLCEGVRADCAEIFRVAFALAQAAKCDGESKQIEAESVYKICHALSVAAPSDPSWLELSGFSVFSAGHVERRFAQCDLMSSEEIHKEIHDLLMGKRVGRKPNQNGRRIETL